MFITGYILKTENK